MWWEYAIIGVVLAAAVLSLGLKLRREWRGAGGCGCGKRDCEKLPKALQAIRKHAP